jgi:hypothetical protein
MFCTHIFFNGNCPEPLHTSLLVSIPLPAIFAYFAMCDIELCPISNSTQSTPLARILHVINAGYLEQQLMTLFMGC